VFVDINNEDIDRNASVRHNIKNYPAYTDTCSETYVGIFMLCIQRTTVHPFVFSFHFFYPVDQNTLTLDMSIIMAEILLDIITGSEMWDNLTTFHLTEGSVT
jgi:hypothetical protein